MRFLCLLFLIVFLAAVGLFAYENQSAVTVTFWQWSYTASLALIVAAAYVLGMLSGWSVVGMVRRSFGRASELLEERQRRARAGY